MLHRDVLMPSTRRDAIFRSPHFLGAMSRTLLWKEVTIRLFKFTVMTDLLELKVHSIFADGRIVTDRNWLGTSMEAL